MPTSANRKSQPGTNGQEDNSLSNSKSSPCPEQQKSSDLSEEQVVKAAEESDGCPEIKTRPGFKSNRVILTSDDKKIQRLMNRSIAERIGFDPNSPSRSFRV